MGDQLDLNDSEVISAQHERRLKDHPTSVKTVQESPFRDHVADISCQTEPVYQVSCCLFGL